MSRYRIYTEWKGGKLDDTGVVVDAPNPDRALELAVMRGAASGLGARSDYVGCVAIVEPPTKPKKKRKTKYELELEREKANRWLVTFQMPGSAWAYVARTGSGSTMNPDGAHDFGSRAAAEAHAASLQGPRSSLRAKVTSRPKT